MSMNKAFISGNLTRDAELSSTRGGLSILAFGVAVNDRRKNSAGEWEDYANFIDCKLFGRRAEALAQALTKGTKVCIEGKLHYSSWEDRNTGQRRSRVEVIVDEIEIPQRDDAAAVQAAFPGAQVVYSDTEIPF